MERGAREAAHRLRRRRDCPTSAQLGNTWIPEFDRARRARAARRARCAASRIAPRRLLRRHPGHTNVDRRRRPVRHAVVRRHAAAVLPHATCSRAAGYRGAARRPGPSGSTRCARSGARRRRADYAIFLPLNEYRAADRARRCSSARRCCATTARAARFAQPGFRRALDFYPSLFQRRPRAGARQHADLQRLPGVRARPLRLLHQRAVEHRRVPAPAAAPSAQDDWATAPLPGPDGPGVSIAGGSSLVLFAALAAQGRGLAADRVPREPDDDAALPRADRRPAAAAQAWHAPGARRRSCTSRAFRDQLERVRAAAARSPSGSASSQRDAARPPSASVRRTQHRRRPLPRSSTRGRPHAREAPLAARATRRSR